MTKQQAEGYLAALFQHNKLVSKEMANTSTLLEGHEGDPPETEIGSLPGSPPPPPPSRPTI